MSRAQEIADLLAGVTITTADNTAQLTLSSTDADANSGPVLLLQRDSGSPADGDNAGLIQFKFDNSAGSDFVSAAQISAKANDVTDDTEDGELELLTIVAGSSRSRIEMLPGEVVINEDSIDSDFRVESDGQTHMFFVDAGNNNIGIKNSSPDTESVLDLGSGENTNHTRKLNIVNTGNSRAGLGALSNIFRMFYADDQVIQFGTVSRDGNFTFSEKMRLTSAGSLLVAQSSSDTPGISNTTQGAAIGSTGRIHSSVNGAFSSFNRNSSDGGVIQFHREGNKVGEITVNSSSTAYVTSSDYRLKENVTYDWDATTRLKQLKPARFNFIADTDTTVDGFLAHEAQAVVPEAVTGTHNEVDDDGNPVYQGIDQSKIVPLLVKTIQELEARIAALEAG